MRLLRDVLIVFATCVLIIVAINMMAWFTSSVERAAESVVEQIDITKISDLSSWFDIYRSGLIPFLEAGLIIAFIGMVIGIFIYARKR